MKKIIAVFSLFFLLTGCYTIYKQNTNFDEKEISVIVSPNYNLKTHKKLAVMPFKGKAYDSFRVPHVVMEEQTSDKFAIQLMSAGFSIVERTQLQRVFSELQLSTSGLLSKSDLNKIGKLMDIDMIVMGNLDDVFNGKYQTASVRFIDIETGEVLIKMVGTNIYGRDYIPAMTNALIAKIK